MENLPQIGQVFETVDEVRALYFANFAAPFSEGGWCLIPPGTQIQVKSILEADPGEIRYIAILPVDYEEMKAIIVPENERNHPRFLEYSVMLDHELLVNSCNLVE